MRAQVGCAMYSNPVPCGFYLLLWALILALQSISAHSSESAVKFKVESRAVSSAHKDQFEGRLQEQYGSRRALQQAGAQNNLTAIIYGKFASTLPNVKDVAIGITHYLVLDGSGTVKGFGGNESGQLTAPAVTVRNTAAIAAGDQFSVALLNNGTVVTWGNEPGTVPQWAQGGVIAIAAGQSHVLALRGDGNLITWGMNNSGQLGSQYTWDGSVRIASISAAGWHSLLLLQNSQIISFGDDRFGQVSGIPPEARTGVVKAVTGGYHCLALKSNGQVVSWGFAEPPPPVNISSGVIDIAAGLQHSLAMLGPQHDVTTWGSDNQSGQLTVPAAAQSGAVRIGAGYWSSYVLIDPSQTNPGIQTPTPVTASPPPGPWPKPPVVVNPPPALLANPPPAIVAKPPPAIITPPPPTFVAIPSPAPITNPPPPTVIKPPPTLVQRPPPVSLLLPPFMDVQSPPPPSNPPPHPTLTPPTLQPPVPHPTPLSVQLPQPPAPSNSPSPNTSGTGTLVSWGSPVTGLPSHTVTQCVAADGGEQHVVVLKSDGTVDAFGSDVHGQTTVPSVLNGIRCIAVAAAANYSLALTETGNIVAWGQDSFGIVSNALKIGPATMIAAGSMFALAVLRDGSIHAWGANTQGQLDIPPQLSAGGITAISAGDAHALAIYGTPPRVVAWGSNINQQASPPNITQTGATKIAAGGQHSLVVLDDGHVIAFGSNSVSQSTIPARVVSPAAIAAGKTFSMALVAGEAVVWGSLTGQLPGPGNQQSVPVAAKSGITAVAAGDHAAFAIQGDAAGTGHSAPPPSVTSTPIDNDNVVQGQSSTAASTPVGAIVGAAVGGAVGLALLVAALVLCLTRKRHPQTPYDIEQDIKPPPDYDNDHYAATYEYEPPAPQRTYDSEDGAAVLSMPPQYFQQPEYIPEPTTTKQLPFQKPALPVRRKNQDLGVVEVPRDHDTSIVPSTHGARISPTSAHAMVLPLHASGRAQTTPVVMPQTRLSRESESPPPSSSQASEPLRGKISQLHTTADNRYHHNSPPLSPGSSKGSKQQPVVYEKVPQQGLRRVTSMASRSLREGAGGSETSSVPQLLPGLPGLLINIDDVTCGDIIGEGRCGKVFRGTWAGNKVVVKLLNMEGAEENLKAALHREVLAMAQLHHPNVARVYGLVDDGAYQGLVMQYYKRGSLARAMPSLWYADLSMHARLKLALQVAAGMSHLHTRRPVPLIHADLKTSNLFLEEDGDRVVIADIGISNKMLSPGSAEHLDTVTASIRAPEVWLNPAAALTVAADVYSFGTVLLEIVTGQPAFDRASSTQICEIVTGGHRARIPDFVPDEVIDVIVDCWQQDPAARPKLDRVVVRLEKMLSDMVDR